jgi:hypothetical protein
VMSIKFDLISTSFDKTLNCSDSMLFLFFFILLVYYWSFRTTLYLLQDNTCTNVLDSTILITNLLSSTSSCLVVLFL